MARSEATYRGARRNAARVTTKRAIKARQTPGQYRQTYKNEPVKPRNKSRMKWDMTIVGSVSARLFRP